MYGVITKFRPRNTRAGFTLIETALATLIVGLGIVSTMRLFAACTMGNDQSARLAAAVMLTTNIQEAMGALSFGDPGTGHATFGPEAGETLGTWEDVDDFDGATFSPPIDSLRQPVANLTQYSQVVSVWPVNPNNLSLNSNESTPDIPKTTYTGAVRVRVRILFRATANEVAKEVYRASWIRLDN